MTKKKTIAKPAIMNILIYISILSKIYQCEAFLPSANTVVGGSSGIISKNIQSSNSRLFGIDEWRDESLQSKYTLDSYNSPISSSPQPYSDVPGIVPILPFPFSDLLLQGQRTQLNLYEDRFHKLFQDAMDNHSGMVGMGLLAGNGMITTLPLCEVESFTRFGTDENWVDKGDGMGNGSIFVTIRAVGRCKIISEDGMLQEEPYFKATVCELLDEDLALEGLKEKSNTELSGVSTPIEIASTIANNIENEMVSIANLEHKLKELESKSSSSSTAVVDDSSTGDEDKTADGKDEVMNRRLVNAQLENLFMQSDSSSEGVDIETEANANNEIEEDDNDDLLEEEMDESKMDRVAQFQKAFEDAKETDTFGYVLQTINVNDKSTIRTPKDLTAISWAAFCTGKADNIQREVMKIQALDETNVLKRLQLAAAMLREEKKVLRAKLSLAGVQDSSSNEQEES